MDEFSRVEIATPALATKWLEANTNNRPVSDHLVERYAEDMRQGRWRVTGQGITFDREGVLLDGQHRLWAIITAAVDVRILVLRNAESAALACVDIGRARTVSDVMKLVDGTAHASRIKAMVGAIDILVRGSYRRLSYFDVREAMGTYKTGIEWILSIMQKRTGVDAPFVAGALAYAYVTNPDGVATFAANLRSGAGLQETDPALVLRNFIFFRKSNRSADKRNDVVKVLRAIMGHLNHERMVRLEAAESAYAFFAKAYLPRAAPSAVLPMRRKVSK